MKTNQQPAPAPPILVSKDDAARLLGISVRHLENVVKARAISTVKIGRRVLIERAEITRYIGCNRKEAVS